MNPTANPTLHHSMHQHRGSALPGWFDLSRLVVAAAVLLSTSAAAAPGSLDPTFNGTGQAQTDVSGSGADDAAACVAVQADGKIVAAGYTGNTRRFALARYNTNGTLDTSFDGDGKVITPMGTSHAEITAMVIQPDGKIVVAGYARSSSSGQDFAVARYNTDGSLDPSFGTLGTHMISITTGDDSPTCLTLDGSELLIGGRAFVDGKAHFVLLRCNENGGAQLSWGFGGVITTPVGAYGAGANAIALQPNGKILLVGYADADTGTWADFAAVRYNSGGALDTSFGTGGKVIIPISASNVNEYGNSVVLQPDGKIVIAGESFPGSALVRCLPDGSLDSTFGTGGKVWFNPNGYQYARCVRLQADGRIVLSNNPGNLMRFRADGSLDPTFGGAGVANGGGGQSIALHTDGKIALCGKTFGDFRVDRFEGLDHLENWRLAHFGSYVPTGDFADTGDPDRDGLANLVEYGFGNHPLQAASSQMPAWQITGSNYGVSFAQPAGVTGLTYRAYWSTTLAAGDWQLIPDSGTASQHVFTASTTGKTRLFVRMEVSRP